MMNRQEFHTCGKGGVILLLFLFSFLSAHGRKNLVAEAKTTPVAVIPFQEINDHIVLTIRLNGNDRPLSFLLDTGADGMAIRKTLADSLGLSVSRSQNADVVGGKMQVNISSGNTVHLSDELSMKEQNIAIFEKVSGFDGIIGLNLIYRYVTKVDFDEHKIYLYAHGSRPFDDGKERIALAIERMGPLLLVPATIDLTGNKAITGNFIMDTGAHYQLILFSRFVRKNRLLLSGFKPEGQAATVSMGHSTPVFYGKAHTFKVGEDIVLNQLPVVLQASAEKDNSEEKFPDGSVGIQFFNRFNFIIDIPGKMVYLEKREASPSSPLPTSSVTPQLIEICD